MKKRKRSIIVAALVVVVLTSIVWLVCRPGTEPLYQGKRVSYWIGQLETSGSDPDPNDPGLPRLRAIGRAAVPSLVADLKTKDNFVKKGYRALWLRLPYQLPLRLHLHQPIDPVWRRVRAAFWIGELGPIAREAVPALLVAMDDPEPKVRREALFAIASLGVGAERALPELLKRLHEPNRPVTGTNAVETWHELIVYALWQMTPEDDATWMAINHALMLETNSSVHGYGGFYFARVGVRNENELGALLPLMPGMDLHGNLPNARRQSLVPAIGKLGSRATAAIPVLLPLLSDEDAQTRRVAFEALGQIGPAASNAVPFLNAAVRGEKKLLRLHALEALLLINHETNDAIHEAIQGIASDDDLFSTDLWRDAQVRMRMLSEIESTETEHTAKVNAAVSAITRFTADSSMARIAPLIQIEGFRATWRALHETNRAVELCIGMLRTNKNDWIQSRTAMLLRDMGPAAKAAATILAEKTRLGEKYTRIEAAKALVVVDSEKAAEMGIIDQAK